MNRFRNLFVGRYGIKGINVPLAVLGAFMVLWSFVIQNASPLMGGLVLLAIAVWRSFSKKIEKRRQEDLAFQYLWHMLKTKLKNLWARLKGAFSSKPSWADKHYKTFRCPKCRQKLRVPRGKGKVRITCSRCQTRFERKA
jgi:LSD1 subclass zinc finger protein